MRSIESGRRAGQWSASLIAMFLLAPVGAAEGPPDGSTPAQKAAIADDPLFRQQSLVLDASVTSPRAARRLFNGRDLSGWDTWLGYANPAITYTGSREAVIGLNHDGAGVFSVSQEDGRPAIRV
ncbi:MAG: hypothetical protein RLZZ200_860, partial [Pseudomonadota bacterium]